MAKYRQLHTTFWNDPLILDLTPEQKYFYIYLLTNPNVKQCGIYEISVRQITYHTGYNKETIEKLLELFVNLNKIVISKKTNEIALVNFLKYNYSASPTIKKCIEKDLDDVKNKELIKYIYSIDSLDIEYVGNNKNKNKNNKKNNNKNELPKTEDEFREYVNKLEHKEHHKDFIDYWCEGSPKMRFTYEKTFDISRRLSRWANNQYSTKKNKIPDYFDELLYKRMDLTAKKDYENHLKDLGYQYSYNPNSGGKWIKK
tara:strand:- start:1696 stop:2466 length:771 start_codon:yes stop_codon:yes gene_type:complete